jgi:hypothetical protein
MTRETDIRKAMALKNMFRTVKTKRSSDGVLLQNNYASIGSMERGEQVPKTRNIFRKSTEIGEEQAPVAVTARKLWLMVYGDEPKPVRLVRQQLFKNTRKTIDYISFDGQHYLMWTNYESLIVLRSVCFGDKSDMMLAYRSGTVRYIESVAMTDGRTASG